MVSEWWNRFLASDPALRRLRNATRVTLATACAIGAAMGVLVLLHRPVTSGMVAAVVAINSITAVNDPTDRERRRTTLLMPVPAALSLTLATATASAPVLHVALFLPVVFAATYIRRFGPRYFAFGMVAFMGYFFAMFLRPQLPQLPDLLWAAVCGAGSAFLLRFVVLRDDPRGVLERGRRTLRAQVQGLLHEVRALAQQPEAERHRKRLRHRSVRLNETARMLEGTVAELDGLDEAGRELLRRRILSVELTAENLLNPLMRVLDHPSGGTAVPQAVAGLLAVVRSDASEVRAAARSLADRIERDGVRAAGQPDDGASRPRRRDGSVELAMAIRRLGAALAELTTAYGDLGRVGPRTDDTDDEGTGQRSGDEREPDEDRTDREETGLRRPELRAAVQVTCAAAMAIVLGQLVSPNRWYWAVITAFVVFISANSRGELLVRAWQRTAGTMLGVVAGVLVASRITGDATAELLMILCCVFAAFYLAGVSYAGMTFFITTMLGALYGVLGTFDVNVLGVRLAETAIGASAGVLAATVVLPTRTRRLLRDNTEDFLLRLRDLLRSTGTAVGAGDCGDGLREAVREVDDALHSALSSARPLVAYRMPSRRSALDRSLTVLTGCAYATRNLAAVLPPTVDMLDEDTRDRLAELLWAMAETAASMTAEATQGLREARESAQSWADDLRDLAESLPQDPTSLHRTLATLDRLRGLLDDLAEETGLGSTPERAPA
ncbi:MULTISPECIES: FUSC family protein [unclassified Saccharopolyspora]|uniref:FUSC family protein n=1 Tax=unclassified Saccharopolyspora TaxID=2646250 RepID=UPI001CD3EC2D|nr:MULTISPECIES: FUSC family protein [unclassified Saccharopolyspora]MCA1185601.1 FUSC family protein [Saccharopolyspora sp. 6T]MCA1191542.1 FUSC family protein [Saccharopolyspora sp. 6V]MCA1226310.1 FUSC family protein [Saccharopolyspora sp. 6M]MCA1280819.1 FUSC family protein [Saccharopolyspora sp. 7B]